MIFEHMVDCAFNTAPTHTRADKADLWQSVIGGDVRDTGT
jgi:hypothetical protein